MRARDRLPVRCCVHLAGLQSRHDRHPDRRVRDRPVPDARQDLRLRRRVRHLHADGPGRVRVLPDLSGYRDPSGSLHVPGILAQAR